MNDNLKTFNSRSEGFAAAADFFRDCAAEAVRDHGFFTVALSGGETPNGLFALLASEYRNQLEWDKGHLFWVDERCVPPDSEFSNYGRAARLLLANVPVPPRNIHRIEAVKDSAAEDYDLLLRNYAMMRRTADGIPAFDIILLGLGLDGHTASLFPGAEALREDGKLAVMTPPPATALPAVARVTLTLRALNSAANLFFLISGHEKLNLAEYISDSRNPLKYPAQLIRPAAKPATWFVCGL